MGHKRWIVVMILVLMAAAMTSCSKKADITGLYMYNKETDQGTEKINIQVKENEDGSYIIKFSDKTVNGDVVSSSSQGELTVKSKVKYGETIDVFADASIGKYQHQFVFDKDYVMWRYALVEVDKSDTEMLESIEDKYYVTVPKYLAN